MSKKSLDPGVYCWKNLKTNKVYIGSSICISRRKSEHILRLNKRIEGNDYFQRAWDKYSAKSFKFFVLERCLIDNRLEREQYWIDTYKATDEKFGYNLIPTRKSQLYGKAISEHQKRGWAKYSKEERKKLNLHLNDPELKARASAKSNEVKKLKPWRDTMEKVAWSKLRAKWQDPIKRAEIIAAQNAGKERARLRKLVEQSVVKINEDIV